MPSPSDDTVSPVASNRKAFHEYFVVDRYEAGIALTGTEIKSVRDHRVNLQDGFVQFRQGEAWLMNVHIAPYDFGNRENHEPGANENCCSTGGRSASCRARSLSGAGRSFRYRCTFAAGGPSSRSVW